MFVSKKRPLIIPQSEHARLSGIVAQYWGNDYIAPPPVDPDAFLLGVIMHDRGYHTLDTMPILEVGAEAWFATQRRGILQTYNDPVADTVVLMHIRRLLTETEREPDTAAALITLADALINNNLTRTDDYTRADFEQANIITHLCDSLSFLFCFEEAASFTLDVPTTDGASVLMHVNVLADGDITLAPWPLSVPELRGFILGYAPDVYPDHPRPIPVPFVVRPA
jgi:hypothetical protein